MISTTPITAPPRFHLKRLSSLSIAVALSLMTGPVLSAVEGEVIDNFEQDPARRWKAEVRSQVVHHRVEEDREGRWCLRWVFKPDDVNRYGNSISLQPLSLAAGEYEDMEFDVWTDRTPPGRIAIQLVLEGGKVLTLDGLPKQVTPGEWSGVKLPLPVQTGDKVVALRFFYDGNRFTKEMNFEILIDNLRLTGRNAAMDSQIKDNARPLPAFSALPAAVRSQIRQSFQPLPRGQRTNPYSTPMYYPQWGSGTADGTQRSDWQEALVREFADLGMTKLHFYLYPERNGQENRTYDVSPRAAEGIREFVRICKQYDMKIGLRVDLPSVRNKNFDADAYRAAHKRIKAGEATPEDVEAARAGKVSYWIANPRNPDNELQSYYGWLKEIVTLLKGNLEYLVLGDEITDFHSGAETDWTQADFIAVLSEASKVVRAVEPDVLISSYAASSGRMMEVIQLLEHGYTEHANALAFNHYDSNVLARFMGELKERFPDAPVSLLSNGVGYISSDTPHRSPPQDAYSRYDNDNQAGMIARTMYSWWAANAETAPYYITIRTREQDGEITPFWYGFLGFMDMVVDEHENMTFRRYPGWYAFRTIAEVFDDRPSFKEAPFAVRPTMKGSVHCDAWVRKGEELIIILWKTNRDEVDLDLVIESNDFGYPVEMDLANYRHLTDVEAFEQDGTVVLKNVKAQLRPTLIRLPLKTSITAKE